MFDLLDEATDRKTLRPYQQKAIDLLRQSFGKGNKRVVIQGPTGFGKTLTAAKIIEGALAKGNRVIFTAPKIGLIDQTISAFEAEGITDIGAIQANHPRTNTMARVQVATVQSLARRDIPNAELVMVDECHENAAVINSLMDERSGTFFVGLSATPWAKGMGNRWDDLIIPCTVGELIDGGYLSQFRAYAPDVPDLSNVKVKAGEFSEADLERVMAGETLVAHVVETWLAKGENRPTFCFAVNRAHAAQLQKQFERAGVSSGYCDAFTDRIEMALLERQFRSGEIKVMCSVIKMTTGIDWPVSCIIDAAPTRSEMRHVQKIGRGLRVNPGTEDLVILDHAGNSLRLGLVTDIHHDRLDTTQPGQKSERKAKAEKLPKECANCATLHSGKTCPMCGHERQPAAGVDTVDGDLVEVTRSKAKVTKADKQKFYSMALGTACNRGYRRGWAANKYREKFGVWPRGLDDIPAAPDQSFMNWEKSRRIAWAKAQAKKRSIERVS